MPSLSSDLIFQHFAIVVADMAQAYGHLRSIEGWSAISRDGPQRLPESSGGVTAFKFRDPERHPLELLAFPDGGAPSHWQKRGRGLCLGIDHSAISVSDAAASILFYESLGFAVSARSHNRGPEQEALDNLENVQVDVIALASARGTPHLELLCYRSTMHSVPIVLANEDIPSTRLILQLEEASHRNDDSPTACSVRDPDGHRSVTLSIPE